MTILSARDITPDERAAIADEPRPGVWVQSDMGGWSGVNPGDGRALSQHDADRLIAHELWVKSKYPDVHEIEKLLGYPGSTCFAFDDGVVPIQQRGGIHSDPLVRLLAYRAWGDRDRAWRKRDTMRALLPTRALGGIEGVARRVYGWDGIGVIYPQFAAQLGDREVTARLRDDRPIEPFNAAEKRFDEYLDLFDELDAKLAAGGEPLPSGPLTYDFSSSPR